MTRTHVGGMTFQQLVLAGAGGVAMLSAAVSAATVWLLFTDPLSIAGIAASRGVTGALAAAVGSLFRHVLSIP